jgi:hypothetical protein
VGTDTFTAVAHELNGSARADVWPALVAATPSVGDFQAKTTREIPVFMLRRAD